MSLNFDYYDGSDVLPKGVFRISPSQFSKFMDSPHLWYREQILGEEGFTGSTSSVLGTIVHACAEAYANGSDGSTWSKEIEDYLKTIPFSEVDIDKDEIRKQYKGMALALINGYLKDNKPDSTEEFIFHNVIPGYVAAGTCDARKGDMVVDYKTYNSKSKPRAIPMYYKYQLLIYAWIYTKKNIPINRVRLVYVNRNIDGGVSEKTGKPLKSYPPEVTVLTETITKEDIDFIESVLKLLAETVAKSKEDPSLTYLLFRDYRLKDK